MPTTCRICKFDAYRCPFHGPKARDNWSPTAAARLGRELKMASPSAALFPAHRQEGYCSTCGPVCRGPLSLRVGAKMTWVKAGFPFEVVAIRPRASQSVVIRYLAGPAALRVVALLPEVVRGKVRPLLPEEWTAEVQASEEIIRAEELFFEQERAEDLEEDPKCNDKSWSRPVDPWAGVRV